MKHEHIIRLCPSVKRYIWGGTKLRDLMNRDAGGSDKVAESWEVSTHPDGVCKIASGGFKGQTLAEYFQNTGWDRLGEYGKTNRRLPVLIKYIDAADDLSIQVHPNDEYAEEHEGDSGKNEAWIVLGADEGAFIYLGFNKNVTREEVLAGIKEGELEKLLNRVEVKEGEIYYIPAGLVHAIGKGCLICEVQQSSNVTYRLYDYGRLDRDGNPRQLHVEKALDVLNYGKTEGRGEIFSATDDLVKMFSGCTHCRVFRYDGKTPLTLCGGRRDLTFALTYGGEGAVDCDGETQPLSAGVTLMLSGEKIALYGQCKTILIQLWS